LSTADQANVSIAGCKLANSSDFKQRETLVVLYKVVKKNLVSNYSR
jgi:hypothetical protein